MAIPIIGEISALERRRDQYRGFMRKARQEFKIAKVMGTEKEKKVVGLEYAEWKRKFRGARNKALTLKGRMRNEQRLQV